MERFDGEEQDKTPEKHKAEPKDAKEQDEKDQSLEKRMTWIWEEMKESPDNQEKLVEMNTQQTPRELGMLRKDGGREVYRAEGEEEDMGEKSDKEIKTIIHSLVRRGSQLDTRRVAALKKMRDPRVLDAVLHFLDHSDLQARIGAVRILGELGDPCAAPHLLAMFKVLAETGLPLDRGELSDQRIVRPLIIRTLDAFVKLGSTDVITPLTEILAKTSDEETRADIIMTLARLGDPNAFSYIKDLMEKAPDSKTLGAIRSRAIICLAESGDPRAVPLLKEYMKTIPSTNCREGILYALSKVIAGNHHFTPYLIELLATNPPVRERMRIISCLGQTRDPHALPSILEALNDEERLPRHTAIGALGNFDDPSAEAALTSLLDSPDAEVAAGTLLYTKGAAALDLVLGSGISISSSQLSHRLTKIGRENPELSGRICDALTAVLRKKVTEAIETERYFSGYYSRNEEGRLVYIRRFPSGYHPLFKDISNVLLRLAQLGETRAVPAIVEMLRNGELTWINQAGSALETLERLGAPIPETEKPQYILDEEDLIIKPPRRAYRGAYAPEHAEAAIRAGETCLCYGRCAAQPLPDYITRQFTEDYIQEVRGKVQYREEEFLPDDDPRVGERRWVVVVHAESLKEAGEAMGNLWAYILDRVERMRRRRPLDDWGAYAEEDLDVDAIIRCLRSGEFYYLESWASESEEPCGFTSLGPM